jgi:AcrR family transcriptional regulator
VSVRAAKTDPEPTKEQPRTRILGTAARLFAERGYDATRMNEIAEAAGLSKASLYNYFKAKSEMLYELQMQSWQHHIEGAEKALAQAGDDDRAAVERLAHAHLEALLGSPTSIGLTALETKALPDDRRATVEGERARYRAVVRGVIARGQASGLLRDDLTERELSLALATTLNGTLIGRTLEDDTTIAELADVGARLFLDGIRDPAWVPEQDAAESERRAFRFELPPALAADPTSRSARSDEILDAAILLFWEKGFASTTTRDLSRAVGLANSSLYHHIAEKEQLLFGAYQRGYRNLYTIMEETFGSSDTDETRRLEDFLTIHTESMLVDSQRSSMMVNGVRYLAERRLELVVDMYHRVRTALRAVIEDAQATGAARADLPPAITARLLLGGCQWSTQWYEPGGPWTAHEASALLAKVWIDGATPRKPARRGGKTRKPGRR